MVVGGTYRESVSVPPHEDDSAGSGFRAAVALGPAVGLVSAVDDAMGEVAAVAAATLGVRRATVRRDQAVGFRYFTPVSNPTVDGPAAVHADPLTAEDDTVLVFGMVETGPRVVRADRVVLDPQRPRDLKGLDLAGVSSRLLAVVANARETRALDRLRGGSLAEAGARVLAETPADVVVVKDSGRGCLVLTPSAPPVRVGPSPTRTVWPLGSGDVFAAGFAHAWARGADPVEAARVGSNSAAWWCGTREPRVPQPILEGADVADQLPTAGTAIDGADDAPLVYLAAPFFSLAERWLVETCRDVLVGLGVRVFSPLHDVGSGGDEVADRDLEGLRRSHAVLALLDGWDPGTVYEAGWAHRQGLPVVGFLNGPGHEGTKMLVGSGAELHRDLSSALYRAAWAAQGAPVAAGRVGG